MCLHYHIESEKYEVESKSKPNKGTKKVKNQKMLNELGKALDITNVIKNKGKLTKQNRKKLIDWDILEDYEPNLDHISVPESNT